MRPSEQRDWLVAAFAKNTRPWRPFLLSKPAGWGHFARRRVAKILSEADSFVQTLNNRFANPSGSKAPAPAAPDVQAQSEQRAAGQSTAHDAPASDDHAVQAPGDKEADGAERARAGRFGKLSRLSKRVAPRGANGQRERSKPMSQKAISRRVACRKVVRRAVEAPGARRVSARTSSRCIASSASA